jgi:hypothetical protein
VSRNRKYHQSCGTRITPFSYLRDIEKTGGLLFSSHQNVVEQRNVCTTATVEVSFKNRYQPKQKSIFFKNTTNGTNRGIREKRPGFYTDFIRQAAVPDAYVLCSRTSCRVLEAENTGQSLVT